MPFFNGILSPMDQKEMMRYAGLPKLKEFPEEEILDTIREMTALAEPRGVWEIFSYDPLQQKIMSPSPLALKGRSIRRHLEDCLTVAIMAVTVGEEAERQISEYFADGHYTRGLLLDAAATAAVEHLADQLNRYIEKKVTGKGQVCTWRFSPGYGDWPVTQQASLCSLLGTEKIDVNVTAYSMLTPRKSVTAVIGISDCPVRRRPKDCGACTLQSCAFRRTAESGAKK